jgi:hypothetical protein
MKTKYLIGALGVLSAVVVACSADSHEVDLIRTTVLSSDCKAGDSKLYLPRGLVDLSATQQYFLGIRWQSNLTGSTDTVGGQTVSQVNANFYGDQVVYSYTSNPAATFETETENLASFIGAGGRSEDNYVIVDALQPKAIATLQGLVTPAAPVELNVTVQVKGHFEDGTSADTNKFSFPITVVDTGFTGCAAGEVQAPATTCGNFGQEQGDYCVDAGTPAQ